MYDVLIGNREWLKEEGIEVSNETDMEMQKMETIGQTVVLCVIDGKTSFSPSGKIKSLYSVIHFNSNISRAYIRIVL